MPDAGSRETARYVARSVRGLEWVAAAEIAGRWPDLTTLTMTPREVRFDLAGRDESVGALRTVDDVFLELGVIDRVGTTKPDLAPLARRVGRLAWPAWDARSFDVVVSLEGRRTYNRYDVENAVGPVIQAVAGGEYLARSPDHSGPLPSDATVRIFLRGSEAVVALRVAPQPLHRRPWKQDTGAGTLHPPVAAALCRLAGLRDQDVVADPFCGDGTVLVEAALLAPGARIRGSDIDPGRVANARANAERAGVDVTVAVADAGRPGWAAADVTAVVTNPPWNVAVARAGDLDRSLRPFWTRVEQVPAGGGRICVIADAALELSAYLRGRRFPIALATQVRLAGRVSEVVLAADGLPTELARWRRRAMAQGLVNETGW